MNGLADWLGRTALLVLSALATLSLIGSLASVSGGSLADAVPGRVGEPATVIPETLPPAPMPAPPPGAAIESGGPTIAVMPPHDDEIARWLKALTYAVLALAGFAAAALLVLLRLTAHLARIAASRA